jgi:uncharacterized protein (TIGR02466 family)
MEIIRPFAPIVGADTINEEHEKISGVFIDSNNGGYGNGVQASKDRRILEKYPILKKILLNKFYEFIKTSNLEYNNRFEISTSWLTKSENKQRSNMHNHKNSFYSGVYYYGDKYESNCGNLQIHNPLLPLSDFLIEPESRNDFNVQIFEIYPQPRLLVFFPSYIEHQFLPNYSDIPRYSLAFNVVPIGLYGCVDSSYDTSWFN